MPATRVMFILNSEAPFLYYLHVLWVNVYITSCRGFWRHKLLMELSGLDITGREKWKTSKWTWHLSPSSIWFLTISQGSCFLCQADLVYRLGGKKDEGASSYLQVALGPMMEFRAVYRHSLFIKPGELKVYKQKTTSFHLPQFLQDLSLFTDSFFYIMIKSWIGLIVSQAFLIITSFCSHRLKPPFSIPLLLFAR